MALEPITRQEKIIAGQDLTPITRMEKFLKQYGGGSGGVTSWNDLTDKPFGEVTTVKEVLAECQMEFPDANQHVETQLTIEFAEGKTYVVIWNGVEYECVAYHDNATSAVCIGNISIVGVDGGNGEPFFIGVIYGNVMIAAAEAGTHTISIRQEVTTTKKISGKYVEGMGWSEEVEGEFYSNSALTFADLGGMVGAMVSGSYEIVEGAPFRVVFDGVEYKCTAQNMAGVANFVGNSSIAGGEVDTGEPFVFVAQEGNLIIYTNKPVGTYSVEIYSHVEIVHPIDRKLFATLTVNIDKNLVADKSFDEIKDAIKSGYDVKLIFTTADRVVFNYNRIGQVFVTMDYDDTKLTVGTMHYDEMNNVWVNKRGTIPLT